MKMKYVKATENQEQGVCPTRVCEVRGYRFQNSVVMYQWMEENMPNKDWHWSFDNSCKGMFN